MDEERLKELPLQWPALAFIAVGREEADAEAATEEAQPCTRAGRRVTGTEGALVFLRASLR